jgi:hypothetical protein
VQEIKTPLRQWLEGFGVEPFQAEVLSNRLPAYFVFELNREWRQRSQDYARITAQVQTPFTQASEREQGWRVYNSWLQKQVKEPMLFEAFGLEDIYVPLRAYYRRKLTRSQDSDDDFATKAALGDKEQYERVVVNLEDCLRQWLQTSSKDDAMRIISGGPGSGKSSFAKIFAAHLSATATFPVLFVPLHQFDPSGDLTKAVEKFVRYDAYLKDNPLDPSDPNLRLLVIFDGLDELALQGKLSKEVAQEFVRKVSGEVRDFNRQETRLQVLITGREVAIQDSFRDPQQILHILPYFMPEDRREKEDGEPYVDTDEQLAQDQRNEWWQRYGAATQKPYTAMPEALDRGNLTEITAQPLLNYLVALSYVQGKLTLSEQTNLNTVYSDLLRAVYERGYEGKDRIHLAIAKLNKSHFIRILEEISLAAWHGDGRTTTVAEIERHCKSSGLQRLLEDFEEGARAGVTRLLAAFYFRQSGGMRSNERTFEFTHKSFGEYLTARRIVRAMERIQKELDRRREDMEDGWDERAALLHWAEVCGPTRMDHYLANFLDDEVALQPAGSVSRWQKTFARLISVMLHQGMPMEKIEPPPRFKQANQWAVHAEEALLAVHAACTEVTNEVSTIDYTNPATFGTWLTRLQGQRTSSENVVALSSLGYLNLENAILDYRDLKGSRLDGARLDGASLVEASLVEASLVRANLVQADLVEANLDGARLDGANLREASLVEASLDGASLRSVNLAKANLANISWNDETVWEGVEGLETAENVPEALKQQLGMSN